MDLNIYQKTINELIEAKIPSPRLEARILIANAVGIEANCVGTDILLNDEQLNKLNTMIAERKNHKPLDKIIGIKGFFCNDFISTSSPFFSYTIPCNKSLIFIKLSFFNIL